MAWHKVGGGSFFKFDTPGKSLEGIWRGVEPSQKYDHDNGVIQTPDGERKLFTINTALVKTLARIRRGAQIKVEYTGKAQSKQGKEYKAFEVFVGDPEHDFVDVEVPVPAADDAPERGDEEVPF